MPQNDIDAGDVDDSGLMLVLLMPPIRSSKKSIMRPRTNDCWRESISAPPCLCDIQAGLLQVLAPKCFAACI